ncbi:MAG: 50S ribosomal protein L20 [Spirochaetes bacterium]|nr:50S ribosomal protein L20 [Spirochaetota bacterium]
MPRVKYSVGSKKRRKKVLKRAKGFWGRRSKLYRVAKTTLLKSLQYAYRDRKVKKREFRKLWITRISAACKQRDMSYSRFIAGLDKANILLNRKVLAYLAVHDSQAFDDIIAMVKKAGEK